MSDEKELTLYLTQTEFDILNWALINLEQYLNSKKDFKKVSELRNFLVDQVMQNHDFEKLKDDHNMGILMTTKEKKALVRKAYFVFRRDQQQKCIECADDAAKKQKQADEARAERGY